jgi:hypothetical protein
MPDYDVAVLGLAVPPLAAPVAAYRPAVAVRNNGLYSANVTGQIRIYRREPPGDLLFTYAISLLGLQPGATGNAQAALFWTPTAADIGKEFLFIADVTTIEDQLETNNHLGPTTVIVVAGEAPPVNPVDPHSPQHEAGGSDQVNLDNLLGKAADPQTPATHADNHEAGGTDVMNVGALQGVLAQDQNVKPHGNTKHSPAMALFSELESHSDATTAHADATNLANRETSGPLTGLVPSAQVAALTTDGAGPRFLSSARAWDSPVPTGLTCLWPDANPTPAGWIDAALQSGQIGYRYIEYAPV